MSPQDRDSRTDREARLLEEFLGETYEARALWLGARMDLTDEVRGLTARLIDTLETADTVDAAVVESVPHMIAAALDASFLEVFGEAGPPRLSVAGDDAADAERRKRVVALLRMGLETGSRAEGLEVLGRLEASRTQVPGLGASFAGWLYVLAPDVFPPLPNHVVRGVGDLLGGSGGVVDSARKVWALSDAHSGLLETSDLGVPAAFLRWIGDRGLDATAMAGDDYYGFNRLVHDTFLSPGFLERLEQEIRSNGLLLFTGPAGTGKTHTAIRLARYLSRDGGVHQLLRAHGHLGYDALVGTAHEPGLLVRVAEMAKVDPAGSYPILIDDIHLLDVREAFGELSLALEFPQQVVTLPGGRPLLLPPNLYILGTAEASQEEMLAKDYGFYRRFSHASFSPDPQKLAEWLQRQNNPVKRVDLVHAFRNLNRLLRERTAGRFGLGHGYLMVEGLDDDNVNAFWESYVIPFVRGGLADRQADMEVYRLSRLV